MKYHFKVNKEKGKIWAECVELKGCFVQVANVKKLDEKLKEVLDLYLSEPYDSDAIFPLPKKRVTGKNVRTVSVSPNVAFAMLLRAERMRLGKSQREMARELGFKNAFSYQRLENAKTANPGLRTMALIKAKMPEISIDMMLESV